MSDTYYDIPAEPQYEEQIRKLQDSDPASASLIFNPLFQKLITNTHFLKLMIETVAENAANDAADITYDEQQLAEVLDKLVAHLTATTPHPILVNGVPIPCGFKVENDVLVLYYDNGE